MNITNKILIAVSLSLPLTLAACGGSKDTKTAVDEKNSEDAPRKVRSENAPKPPSDEEMKAKQLAAAGKAKKASTGERNEFIALVDKYTAAKKQPGGIPAGDCGSWARK